jgi:hypothetical protein
MALISAGFSIAGVNTATTTLLNLKASSTVPIYVVEVGIFYAVLSTNAYQLALVRMNAVGTGAITSTAGAAHTSGGDSQRRSRNGMGNGKANRDGIELPPVYNATYLGCWYYLAAR